MSYFHLKKLHRRVAEIVRAIALTYYFEAAGSRRPGGIMVSVFFLGVCCLLFLCVVHEVTVLVKKIAMIVLLGLVVSHRWFDGFETNFQM
jgi:hypothetical protein